MAGRADALTKICAVVCAVVCIVGAVGTVSRAAAVWEDVTETGRPGLLRLNTATATPMWATLSPGDRTHWLVAATLLTAPEGDLRLELNASGGLIETGAPTVSVQGCDAGFTLHDATPVCPDGGETFVAETPLSSVLTDDRMVDLNGIVRDRPRELLVTLAVPATASASRIAGQVVHVGLGLHASGASPGAAPAPVPAPPAPRLVMTGADAVPLALLAAGLIGAAVCVRRLRVAP